MKTSASKVFKLGDCPQVFNNKRRSFNCSVYFFLKGYNNKIPLSVKPIA
jgi:hypothetical protein